MIYFLLGFSICLNIVLIVFNIIIYKKITPIYKSSGVDLDFFDKIGDLNV